MTEFKVGDVVEVYSQKGIVTDIGEYIGVSFPDNKDKCYFTLDGKWRIGLTQELKFVERPKKKVTKTVEAWANVYQKTHDYRYMFKSKQSADDFAVNDRIACVRLTGSYEIEE